MVFLIRVLNYEKLFLFHNYFPTFGKMNEKKHTTLADVSTINSYLLVFNVGFSCKFPLLFVFLSQIIYSIFIHQNNTL